LKFRGEQFAEVWFKPEGQPFALTFRIPPGSFQIPGIADLLTIENLLRAVGVATHEVQSWRHEGASHAAENGANPALEQPLPPPAADASHLSIYVCLKSASQAGASYGSNEPEIPEKKWQDLESRWNTILGVEGSMESLRLTMEGLQGEMQASLKQTLTTEEKVHAFNADLAQWNKAKNRVHYALPKIREFIHRATWVMATPERKDLDELFKTHVQHRIPFPQMDKLPDQLENLLKDRQVLSAHGVTVYQECKNITADIQGALRTLQNNSAANADRKRRAAASKGKFFKDVRRWTGVD
jgi:hypothetical protein